MKQKLYALVGKNLSHSFSQGFFQKKFAEKGLVYHRYLNFELPDLEELPEIIETTEGLKGLNVTIPYKETIIPILDSLSKTAAVIGAVNTVTISKKGILKGYNTDHYGFRKALKPMLQPHHRKALILGTGGASKAVAYALRRMKIEYDFVSRNATDVIFSYDCLNEEIFSEYQIIINTTPLGTFPKIEEAPPINYRLFTEGHIAFDLVYNPKETAFLRQAKLYGAITENGYKMLVHQAEKSWKIWNK